MTEVSAVGTCLVDPEIGKAGDVDTCIITLRFANGAIGVIDNSHNPFFLSPDFLFPDFYRHTAQIARLLRRKSDQYSVLSR